MGFAPEAAGAAQRVNPSLSARLERKRRFGGEGVHRLSLSAVVRVRHSESGSKTTIKLVIRDRPSDGVR